MENPSSLIPFTKPALPALSDVQRIVEESYASGQVMSGPLARSFEEEIQRLTESRNAVAVSSCTFGLMLAIAALEFPEGSEVIVPAFTSPPTVESLYWNRLTPIYVDCLTDTMTIDPEEVAKAISPKTVAILPVTVFGLPPDIDRLKEISEPAGVSLVFDSAQGLGSVYKGRPVGSFGRCEVFSLDSTAVITAVEGGVITTNDDALAEKLRRARRPTEETSERTDAWYMGLGCEMSEFHAAVGLLNVREAESMISSRQGLIMKYRRLAESFIGCRTQELPDDRISNGNFFVLLVGPGASLSRDEAFEALKQQNIESRKLFFPPVHVQKAFRNRPHRVVGRLDNTSRSSQSCLALPLSSRMNDHQFEQIGETLRGLFTGCS